MTPDTGDLSLFVRGPVVIFKWRNAAGWPVEYASPNVVEVFGYTAEDFLTGTITYAETLHHEDLGRVGLEVREASASGVRSFEHEPYRIRRRDGAIRWLYDVTHLLKEGEIVTHYLGYVIDITARIEAEQQKLSLERQLLHSQKLESLGLLAGGIAHDFNNLLTGILGEVNLARIAVSSGRGNVRRNIEQVEALARRAADLTRQLLAYSGKGRFLVEPVDLSEVVSEMSSMLGVLVSKKARLELAMASELPAIQADRGQLQQVVVNLITNAAEALEGGAGLIKVSTHAVECDQGTLSVRYGAPTLAPGRYVVLQVEDDGTGMSEEVQARIFDPFFSTKATGRGLGMSAIQGIVRSHLGAIHVASRDGEGTVFTLLFPATHLPAVLLEREAPVSGWRGQGSVLVVDDEPAVRRVVTELLGELGFRGIEASNGAEAMEIYLEDPEEICLVLLDLIMPMMDGAETLTALRNIAPELPVVLSSGFHDHEAITEDVATQGLVFLKKPFQLVDLERAVRKALDGCHSLRRGASLGG